jgi:hypothetical protein
LENAVIFQILRKLLPPNHILPFFVLRSQIHPRQHRMTPVLLSVMILLIQPRVLLKLNPVTKFLVIFSETFLVPRNSVWNIMVLLLPFQTGNTSLLHDTLDGLQRGANITQLPRRIQQDYYQGLQGLMSRFAQDLSVRPTAVLTRLAAILKNPPATSSDSTPPSLTAYLAAETTKPATQRSSRTPSTERSTEAAFLAHTPEKRTTFAPRPSSDKRPPFDQRPSADKSPASANRSRPSSQRSAASTDYQRRLSDAQEIDELRQMISVFQSKIDKRQNRIDHANPDHAETHRPGSSTKDYAYTAYSLAGDASSCGESEFGYAGRD